MSPTVPVPAVPVPSEHMELFVSINAFVHEYMSSPDHDNSHDYHHILRVLSNANRLLKAEQESHPGIAYDNSSLFLAALLHDVGDYKYAKAGEDVEGQVSALLLERGATIELALKVQTIVKNVGYTNETKNPQSVLQVVKKYPELAIVQDADRLDAIGAVGVARCFAFGGAKKKGKAMATALEHFEEKLGKFMKFECCVARIDLPIVKLPDMMKTESGKKMAQERKTVLVEFAKQFEAEAALSFTFVE